MAGGHESPQRSPKSRSPDVATNIFQPNRLELARKPEAGSIDRSIDRARILGGNGAHLHQVGADLVAGAEVPAAVLHGWGLLLL